MHLLTIVILIHLHGTNWWNIEHSTIAWHCPYDDTRRAYSVKNMDKYPFAWDNCSDCSIVQQTLNLVNIVLRVISSQSEITKISTISIEFITLSPDEIYRHFAHIIFKFNFLNKNHNNLIQLSHKFVLKGTNININIGSCDDLASNTLHGNTWANNDNQPWRTPYAIARAPIQYKDVILPV